jgi:hypothetical protein
VPFNIIIQIGAGDDYSAAMAMDTTFGWPPILENSPNGMLYVTA